jgi:quercetin dioxygenase-like cupin family protein
MRKIFYLLMVMLYLISALPQAVSADELPPGPNVLYRSSFTATDVPPEFDLMSLVLEFPAGAATPLHTHGGQGIVTVLSGELVHRPEGGEARTLTAGESFTETPGQAHTAANESDAPTRVLFTALLPEGAELTTVQGATSGQELPPGPNVIYRASFEATEVPAQFDVMNLVLEFPAGAATPLHTHGGQGIVTVLEGSLVHRPQGGEAQTLAPGESFIETPGHAHTATNESGAPTRVVFTVLLPKGVELTTVLPTMPTTLPTTGASETNWFEPWILLGAGLVLAFTSRWVVRRESHLG